MGVRRPSVRLLLAVSVVLLMMLVRFEWFFHSKFLHERHTINFHPPGGQWATTKDWKTQRNDGRGLSGRLAILSRELNAIQRRLQQISCLSSPVSGTSNTGGWCSDATGREHRTDQALARALSCLLVGRTAASLGDGLGEYGRAIADTGLAERVDSFDGAPFVEEATAGRVRFLDLAVPQYWLPVYDWTVCLEVLEHVPPVYETTALDNLVRPARIGVVLSWARPGQGGFAHVNPRPHDYVVDVMERRGFRVDEVWTTKLRDTATLDWFRFTVNVYRRTEQSLRLFDWRTNWTDVI